MTPRPDPTRRFSDRVADYVRYRPGYPAAVIDTLEREAGLAAGAAVADVGSGTGISARLFLDAGCRVWGVEPNAAMRRAAEELLGSDPRFTSVDGSAEATGLADASVDLVVSAQAFHWFDRPATAAEWRRILRPRGQAVLMWNRRLTEGSRFASGYEELLLAYGTDYREVDHRRIGEAELAELFAHPYAARELPNHQQLDLAGLRGRLLSSSYAPAAGHPRHRPMLAALEELFASSAEDGRVRIDYTTELYFGPLAPVEAEDP